MLVLSTVYHVCFKWDFYIFVLWLLRTFSVVLRMLFEYLSDSFQVEIIYSLEYIFFLLIDCRSFRYCWTKSSNLTCSRDCCCLFTFLWTLLFISYGYSNRAMSKSHYVETWCNRSFHFLFSYCILIEIERREKRIHISFFVCFFFLCFHKRLRKKSNL